jgi:hypothetical protein
MKIFILLFLMFLSLATIAQTQNGFSYQAVIRNSSGELVKNAPIGMQVSILQGSETGSAVYTETQTPVTNNNGLATTEIGIIDSVGFAAINWAEGPYFLKIETDPNGGTNYTISGVSKLLSVPYALYAKYATSSGNAGNGTATAFVFTKEASMVTTTSAHTGGNVVSGGAEITERGVCWSTVQNPAVNDNKTSDGTGFGYYTSELSGLTPGATYFIRAYAVSAADNYYGNQVVLSIPLNVIFPTVTTTAISNITASAAVSGGIISSTGGGEITAQGVCWSANQNPTISDSKTTDGATNGQFQSQISGLVPGAYYVRAYATNSAGTGYGTLESFSTEKTLPVLTTKDITDISAMGAVSGGEITSTGGGTISEKGICWGESENPTVSDNKVKSGSGTSGFSSAIITATPGTNYYLRAYAINELGTAYGLQANFTTLSNSTYYGFETGMKPDGWEGQWTVSNIRAFEKSYSLKSLTGVSSTTSLSATLSNSGQISFYYYLEGTFEPSLYFYIDDQKVGSFPVSSGWNQGLFQVEAGQHNFKWTFNSEWSNCTGYIDYIVFPE